MLECLGQIEIHTRRRDDAPYATRTARRASRTAARTVRASLADSNAGQLAVFAPAGDAGSLAVSDDARLLAHGHGDEDDAEEVEEASALRAGR